MQDQVKWLPVVGYEDLYQVSSAGDVRSVSGLLKPEILKGGYFRVALCRDGQRSRHLVQRLVLDAFVGACPELEARHKNGVPNDNRLSNLEWGTRSENQLDSVRHGTHNMARVTECPQGHSYDRVNTYIKPTKRGWQRVCRECNRTASREYQRAKRLRVHR